MKEEIIFLSLGCIIFCFLILVVLKGFFASLKKRKIQKILQWQNIQAYCINRIRLNGKKFYIYQDNTHKKEYLVDQRGEIRDYKRFF